MSADRQVIKRFEKRVSRSKDNYDEFVMAVHNKRNQPSLESQLAEQLVMSVAVAWEAFITDLLIAYVTLDPKASIESLKSKISKSLNDKYGVDAAKAVKFSFPKSLTKARAAAFIDPKGWNIPLKSSEALSQRANELLSAQNAKKFSLNADDSHFLDFVICARNYLSHRSDASRQALKTAISQAGGKNDFLASRFADIGTYLKN